MRDAAHDYWRVYFHLVWQLGTLDQSMEANVEKRRLRFAHAQNGENDRSINTISTRHLVKKYDR